MKKSVTKSEYLKLLRRTETELRAELKKPDAEQDAVLIDECLETLDYCRSELALMRAPARGAVSFMRTALASVLALVLTFALGASIAQAAGFRVWTAIIKQDAGYLRVDYVPVSTAAPTERAAWKDEQKSFYDHASFAEELAENGFTPFFEEWQGYSFLEGSIRSTENEYYSGYTMRSDSGFIRVRMIAKAIADTTTSIWGLDAEAPAVHLLINGVEAAYQVNGSNAFATWQEGERIYSVSLYDDVSCIEPLLYALIGNE